MPNIGKSFNEALSALNNGDMKRAEELFRRVIKLDKSNVHALNLLVVVLMSMQRFAEAEPFIQKATSLNQNSDVSFYNYGLIAKHLHKPRQALDNFSKALKLNSSVAETWNNRGTVFNDLKEYDLAIADFNKAIALNSLHGEAYNNKGKSLTLLKRYDEAFAAYDRALSIRPDLAEAWLGRGNVFNDLERYDEAVAAYDKALSIRPDLAEAWLGRGNVFTKLERHDEAFAAYDKALLLKPDLEGAEGVRLHAKMQLCRWEKLEEEIIHLTTSVQSGKASVSPFVLLSLAGSADNQLRYTQAWVDAKIPKAPAIWQGSIYTHERIRIGYMSADLRVHPVSHLIAGVFERHNRSQFEIIGFSFGPNDQSELRRRLEISCDEFIDAKPFKSDQFAKIIRTSEIDILVDLSGFTQNARTEVLSLRPAPIQVNYLGYPGTMAAPYIDYIIGDPIIIPETHKNSYSEKVAYMPHSYMPHDDKNRLVSAKEFNRVKAGLPHEGFVFCCFNSAYKIAPKVFRSWMNILRATEGSVLWLSVNNSAAKENLRKEAKLEGINSDRLVFSERLRESADHLARHRLAGLFLDTLPYNAHTTASDALWAGLPVLTQIGETFAGRVAASLLSAIGLPELITQTSEQYESLAIELAKNPNKLSAIKDKLETNRFYSPLFDTPLFTKHIEAAYQAMHDRYRSGLPPEHIYVPA